MANAIDKAKSKVYSAASKAGYSASAVNAAVNKTLAGSTKNTSTSTANKTSTSSSSNKNSVSTVGKTGASAAAIQAASQAATAKNTSTGKKSSSSSSGSGSSSAAVAAAKAAANQAYDAGSKSSSSGSGASTAASNAVNQAIGVKSTGVGTSTAGVNAGYTPLGTYNDAEMRAAATAAYIDEQKAYWNTSKANYDAAMKAGRTNEADYWKGEMNKAHYNAEMYRSQNGGYSGGPDGSQWIAAPQGTSSDVWSTLPGTTTTQNDPNYIDGVYVHPADQQYLSAADLKTVIALKKQWPTASEEERKRINETVEAIRKPYGYSLGSSGNKFTKLEEEEDIMPKIGLPSYEMNPEMINAVYDRLNDATLSQLMASYNNSRAQTEHDMTKIPVLYNQQRNATSADNEREKLAFREQAAASGMNAGNRSQANLAYSNQLQNSLGQLNTAEANALTEMQFSLTQLYNSYQQQIAQAVAENNYQRAAALLQDYTKAKESAVATALNQADLDYRRAEFNRQTHMNNVANQQNAWQQQFSLASALADINLPGMLGSMGGVSQDAINQAQRDFNVLQLGQYYPLLRGYL